MPIVVSDHHLLDNLLNVLVRSLDCTVHLRSVRRGVMMLNLEIVAQFFHHIVIQICAIIRDDFVRNTVATNDVILDKTDHHLLGHISIRCNFNPLSEVINSH